MGCSWCRETVAPQEPWAVEQLRALAASAFHQGHGQYQTTTKQEKSHLRPPGPAMLRRLASQARHVQHVHTKLLTVCLLSVLGQRATLRPAVAVYGTATHRTRSSSRSRRLAHVRCPCWAGPPGRCFSSRRDQTWRHQLGDRWMHHQPPSHPGSVQWPGAALEKNKNVRLLVRAAGEWMSLTRRLFHGALTRPPPASSGAGYRSASLVFVGHRRRSRRNSTRHHSNRIILAIPWPPWHSHSRSRWCCPIRVTCTRLSKVPC